jgi:hypothetical protein
LQRSLSLRHERSAKGVVWAEAAGPELLLEGSGALTLFEVARSVTSIQILGISVVALLTVFEQLVAANGRRTCRAAATSATRTPALAASTGATNSGTAAGVARTPALRSAAR